MTLSKLTKKQLIRIVKDRELVIEALKTGSTVVQHVEKAKKS